MRTFALFVFMTSQAFGAWTPIGNNGNTSSGVTIANTTGADFLVVVVSSSAAAASITDKVNGAVTANVWNLAVTSAGNIVHCQVWWSRPITVGVTHLFTADGATYASVFAAAYSGSTASPVDVFAAGTSATGAVPSGTITPGFTNELIIAGVIANGVGTPTLSSTPTMTIANVSSGGSGSANAGGLAYLIQTAPVTTSGTWTVVPTIYNAAAIVGFKGASSVSVGGPVRIRHRVTGGG